MATQVIQKVIDDLTGEEGASTAEFSLDGVTYEVDLTETSRKQLHDVFAPYIDAGRKVGSRRGRSIAARGTAAAKVDREQTQAIREWARRNGLEVSQRGRISELVRVAYNANDPSLATAATAV